MFFKSWRFYCWTSLASVVSELSSPLSNSALLSSQQTLAGLCLAGQVWILIRIFHTHLRFPSISAIPVATQVLTGKLTDSHGVSVRLIPMFWSSQNFEARGNQVNRPHHLSWHLFQTPLLLATQRYHDSTKTSPWNNPVTSKCISSSLPSFPAPEHELWQSPYFSFL